MYTYKKGKVHSEEYYLFKYYRLLCFQVFNGMLALFIPTSTIRRYFISVA